MALLPGAQVLPSLAQARVQRHPADPRPGSRPSRAQPSTSHALPPVAACSTPRFARSAAWTRRRPTAACAQPTGASASTEGRASPASDSAPAQAPSVTTETSPPDHDISTDGAETSMPWFEQAWKAASTWLGARRGTGRQRVAGAAHGGQGFPRELHNDLGRQSAQRSMQPAGADQQYITQERAQQQGCVHPQQPERLALAAVRSTAPAASGMSATALAEEEQRQVQAGQAGGQLRQKGAERQQRGEGAAAPVSSAEVFARDRDYFMHLLGWLLAARQAVAAEVQAMVAELQAKAALEESPANAALLAGWAAANRELQLAQGQVEVARAQLAAVRQEAAAAASRVREAEEERAALLSESAAKGRKLAAAQQELDCLEGRHGDLQREYDRVSAELAAAWDRVQQLSSAAGPPLRGTPYGRADDGLAGGRGNGNGSSTGNGSGNGNGYGAGEGHTPSIAGLAPRMAHGRAPPCLRLDPGRLLRGADFEPGFGEADVVAAAEDFAALAQRTADQLLADTRLSGAFSHLSHAPRAALQFSTEPLRALQLRGREELLHYTARRLAHELMHALHAHAWRDPLACVGLDMGFSVLCTEHAEGGGGDGGGDGGMREPAGAAATHGSGVTAGVPLNAAHANALHLLRSSVARQWYGIAELEDGSGCPGGGGGAGATAFESAVSRLTAKVAAAVARAAAGESSQPLAAALSADPRVIGLCRAGLLLGLRALAAHARLRLSVTAPPLIAPPERLAQTRALTGETAIPAASGEVQHGSRRQRGRQQRPAGVPTGRQREDPRDVRQAPQRRGPPHGQRPLAEHFDPAQHLMLRCIRPGGDEDCGQLSGRDAGGEAGASPGPPPPSPRAFVLCSLAPGLRYLEPAYGWEQLAADEHAGGAAAAAAAAGGQGVAQAAGAQVVVREEVWVMDPVAAPAGWLKSAVDPLMEVQARNVG